MLRLNFITSPSLIGLPSNSNTTNVKVKLGLSLMYHLQQNNSNTTNVKVKPCRKIFKENFLRYSNTTNVKVKLKS